MASISRPSRSFGPFESFEPFGPLTQALEPERIVDRTGLSGHFDFELTYAREGLSVAAGESGVDIFGAVRQQFGLKLEPGRAPFEIAVVESVRRPTPD